MQYRIKRYSNNGDPSTDLIRFVDENNIAKGAGFISNRTNRIGLIRCPECLRENYAPNVIHGVCTWCPFDANKLTESN